MKRILIIIACVLLLILIVFGTLYLIDMNKMKNNEPIIFSTWGKNYTPAVEVGEPPIDQDVVNHDINEAIKKYILAKDAENPLKYDNETWFMSMKTYSIENESDNTVIVCAWILEESFYKENDEVKMNSGSSIPYKFTLENKDNNYTVVDCQMPNDGSYGQDMKEIFPENVLNYIEKVPVDGTIDELISDIEKQAIQFFDDV